MYADAGTQSIRSGRLTRAQDHLAQLSETAHQAHKELRLLLFELRPVLLSQHGLAGAIRQRLETVEERAGMQTSFHCHEPLNLTRFVEEGLYRIVQEALNNTLNHTNADRVDVVLRYADGCITLSVSDNGIGCDHGNMREGVGMGLTNMRLRAEKLGGTFSITGRSHGGTTIVVSVPSQGGKGC